MSGEEVNSLRRSPREHVQTYKFHSSHAIYALAMSNLKRALQLNVKASLLKEGVEYPQTNSVRRLLELLANVRNNDRLRETLMLSTAEAGRILLLRCSLVAHRPFRLPP